MTIPVSEIAHLAMLNLEEQEALSMSKELEAILAWTQKIDAVDTTETVPDAHAQSVSQPLRPDEVTETDQRALFQEIAPAVEAGLYLVPKVIE